MQCRKCQTEVIGLYCPQCGQPKVFKRITWEYVIHDLFHVLHLEKGIFSTIWHLLRAPGKTIREYIDEDRTKIIKPVLFLIMTSLIFTVFQKLTHVGDDYFSINEDVGFDHIKMIFNWMNSNYGYANLLMSIFIVLWLKVFFRRAPYNFFELMVLLCYVIGMGMVFSFVFSLIEWSTGKQQLNQSTLFTVIYSTYAIGNFYIRKSISTYVKAFWAYFLGFLTFAIFFGTIGVSLDYQDGKFDKIIQELQEHSQKESQEP